MPTTIDELFAAARVGSAHTVRWGDRVSERRSGVYVVALTEHRDRVEGCLASAPIDGSAVAHLLDVRPELTVDGASPTAGELADRVASFWAADETAVYIGRAGLVAQPRAVGRRISEYYKTPLGARRPHAGGWFLKLLSNLDQLSVHYAAVEDPHAAEGAMIAAYIAGLSDATRRSIRDPVHPFPFANLEFPKGTRKLHGIRGACGDLARVKD